MKKERILLVETILFDISKQQMLESIENNNGRIVLVGKVQSANKKNGNGRIYPLTVLQAAVEKYRQLVMNGGGYGEADHSDKNIVEWKNTCIRIADIWWEGTDVMAKLVLFNNEAGLTIKEAIATGGKIGISSRALGSVTQVQESLIVDPDLDLICFDLVTNPSTDDAYMEVQTDNNLHESVIKRTTSIYNNVINLINDIMDNGNK